MPAPIIPASDIDVLIVGAGPTGLMLATWLSRYNIKVRIIDKRGTKIFNGQADGLQDRTLEIFDSFDFAHRVWYESNHLVETCLWNPDQHGVIRRSDRLVTDVPGLSRFHQVVLHQGRIEQFFLDSIKEYSDIAVERGVLPISFKFDEAVAADAFAHPITIEVRHLTEEESTPPQIATSINRNIVSDGLYRSNIGVDDTQDLIDKPRLETKANCTETVHAKFMVGCDGAHSWVRHQLGPDFKLHGESTDHVWGVMDIIPITDFPDIRNHCTIHSAEYGSAMIIPRENRLARLYIQLMETEKGAGGRADRTKINPSVILAAANRVLAPYKVDYHYCDWWTAYQVGQRVGDKFSLHERVFLAGDAIHTHSPKAGQGMNVSVQDTYNLGWKLASVILGHSNIAILKTYEEERKKIAKDLIAFDRQYSRLVDGRPAKHITDKEGVSIEELKEVFEKVKMFGTGISIDYQDSIIVAKSAKSARPHLAKNIKLGMRMPSYQVLNQSDARPWQVQQLLKSIGCWRVILFAGDISKKPTLQRLEQLGARLDSANAFLKRFTPADKPHNSIIEVLTIHSAKRVDIELSVIPPVFHPYSATEGWDYWKVFVDDASYHEGHGEAYKGYGIDAEHGCAVILRPDSYVSWVGDMDDYSAMDAFFSGFLLEANMTKSASLRANETKAKNDTAEHSTINSGAAATLAAAVV